MWVLILLAAIFVVLAFGPVVSGLLMLAGFLGLSAFGVLLLCALGLWGFVVGCGALAWCIWWVFDREGAMASYRAALRRQEARR